MTSGDTRCWLSALINLDQGLRLCLQKKIVIHNKKCVKSSNASSSIYQEKIMSKIKAANFWWQNLNKDNTLQWKIFMIISCRLTKSNLLWNMWRIKWSMIPTSQRVHQVEDQAPDDTYSNMHSVHQSQAPVDHT